VQVLMELELMVLEQEQEQEMVMVMVLVPKSEKVLEQLLVAPVVLEQ
tara:strand:+ start:649 stop:789 length:141 start_codon:yes stop_codon:yes gene_type:complete